MLDSTLLFIPLEKLPREHAMNDPKPAAPAQHQFKNPALFRQQCYLGGAWQDADNGRSIPVKNPTTGEVLGAVPDMGVDQTRRAIEAANVALPGWRAKTAKERAVILRRWFELMMANQDDLAALLTAEQGKPFAEAKGEIAYGAAFSMANDTEFGLACYFFPRNVGRIFRVSEALEYGIVDVNTGLISTEIAPFGGVKESGIGREGSNSGIEDYLEIKYVCLGGI